MCTCDNIPNMKHWTGRTFFFVVVPLVLLAVYGTGVFVPGFAGQLGGLGNLITFITALLAYAYVILTASMVQTMSRAQEEESRPRIMVDIEFEREHGSFEGIAVIRNIGKTPAYGLSVEFQPDLAYQGDSSPDKRFLEEPIAFLPPDYLIRTPIGFEYALFEPGMPQSYKVRVRYSAAWKSKPISEEYEINLSVPKGGASYKARADMNDIVRHLERIGTELQSIESQMSNARPRLQDIMYGPVHSVRISNLSELSKVLPQHGTEAPHQANQHHGITGRARRALKILLDVNH